MFAEPIPKDNEAATWREKLDQLYKSSSQNFRVVVHGSKVGYFPGNCCYLLIKLIGLLMSVLLLQSRLNLTICLIIKQHNAEQFERLLKEMCADEEGDLLVESAVKGVPKVFVVSTLVSVTPAQPFVFRNYQVHLLFMSYYEMAFLHIYV